jgi:hypothetical protein
MDFRILGPLEVEDDGALWSSAARGSGRCSRRPPLGLLQSLERIQQQLLELSDVAGLGNSQ